MDFCLWNFTTISKDESFYKSGQNALPSLMSFSPSYGSVSCSHCGLQNNHPTNQCKHKKAGRPIRCYTCGVNGHKSKYCQNKRPTWNSSCNAPRLFASNSFSQRHPANFYGTPSTSFSLSVPQTLETRTAPQCFNYIPSDFPTVQTQNAGIRNF